MENVFWLSTHTTSVLQLKKVTGGTQTLAQGVYRGHTVSLCYRHMQGQPNWEHLTDKGLGDEAYRDDMPK